MVGQGEVERTIAPGHHPHGQQLSGQEVAAALGGCPLVGNVPQPSRRKPKSLSHAAAPSRCAGLWCRSETRKPLEPQRGHRSIVGDTVLSVSGHD